jgi:bifunctional DNA-binding transcriptional regulator/antitoxin component of YhaV-PrlF toxin-antitoxin module
MMDGMQARMTSRGRVTIPIELRPRCEFGIKSGMRLIVREVDEGHEEASSS